MNMHVGRMHDVPNAKGLYRAVTHIYIHACSMWLGCFMHGVSVPVSTGGSSSSRKRSRKRSSKCLSSSLPEKATKKQCVDQDAGPRTWDACCCELHFAYRFCIHCHICLGRGIDLATPYAKRDAEDLDKIIFDAMLEGFDTGVSCCQLQLVNLEIWFVACMGMPSKADSARHVVSMGRLFSRFRTPSGGFFHAWLFFSHLFCLCACVHAYVHAILACILWQPCTEVQVNCCRQWAAGLINRIGLAICTSSSTNSTWPSLLRWRRWICQFVGRTDISWCHGHACLSPHGCKPFFRRPRDSQCWQAIPCLKDRNGKGCFMTFGWSSKLREVSAIRCLRTMVIDCSVACPSLCTATKGVANWGGQSWPHRYNQCLSQRGMLDTRSTAAFFIQSCLENSMKVIQPYNCYRKHWWKICKTCTRMELKLSGFKFKVYCFQFFCGTIYDLG